MGEPVPPPCRTGGTETTLTAFVFLFLVAIIAICALGLGISNAAAFSKFKSETDYKLADQENALSRWREDSEQLDIQLGNICREMPKHPICQWYLEDFKQRG